MRRIEPAGDEMELAWRLRRALLTVIFLAVQPARRASRDDLIGALWPEASAAAVNRNFHPTLTDARRTLAGGTLAGGVPAGARPGGLIVLSHGIYILSPEADWNVDIERYRRQIEAGRVLREASPVRALEVWESAWKLHHGPFLAGFDAPWIDPWRDALKRDHQQLLKDLGELAIELDQTTLALDAYRSVLLEEPYEEHIHIKLMELYADQGRRDLVRKQYVRLQEHLKEIGIEPLESTQSNYHRLMR